MGQYWPTWVEINLDHIAHNVREIKKRVGNNVSVMAVVKGDAYGHGALEVALTALENGANKLGIATVEEGVMLREKGIKAPILILGHVFEDAISTIVNYDLMQTVCTREIANALSEEGRRQNKTATINIKVNTGMNRIGIDPDKVVDFIKYVNTQPNIYIEGIFTHLATSYVEEEFTNIQYESFIKVLKDIESEGINIPYKHCCNTGGILNFPNMYLSQVRPGVILTTTYPAIKKENNMSLKDSFSLKSKVIFIREISKGDSIGYNLLYTADSDRKIAVVSAGWGDGIPRELSNKGYVLIRGVKCPIRGRVCCEQTLVDVTDLEGAQIGDEAVFIGKQGKQEIVCWEWGEVLGGVSSPITLRSLVTNRVQRIYIKDGKKLEQS